jgi:NAD(P)-dependent dehydrogenase (short-subunit alcohol dehydrogenase family)
VQIDCIRWLGLLRVLYGAGLTRTRRRTLKAIGRDMKESRPGGTMSCARKHTLVTGCSSGIGRATVLQLAAAGQHVYAGVRRPADGERLARSAAGGEITPLILDITATGHITAAAAAITGHTGPAGLDGLVNNAGYGLACPTELVPLDAFRRQLEVNVTGQLAVTQACCRHCGEPAAAS